MKIIVDGIEYDNEKDAKKAIAKAKREEARIQDEAFKMEQLAYLHARENLGELTETIDYYAKNPDVAFPVRRFLNKKAKHVYRLFWEYAVDTARGSATIETGYREPMAVIEDNGGNTQAILLEEGDGCQRREWFAVGVAGTIIAWVRVPAFVVAEIERLTPKVFEREVTTQSEYIAA